MRRALQREFHRRAKQFIEGCGAKVADSYAGGLYLEDFPRIEYAPIETECGPMLISLSGVDAERPYSKALGFIAERFPGDHAAARKRLGWKLGEFSGKWNHNFTTDNVDDALRYLQAEYALVGLRPFIPELERHCGSWVVIRKDNGEVVCESFDRRYVERFNPDKVIVETAAVYLGRLNREGREATTTTGVAQ